MFAKSLPSLQNVLAGDSWGEVALDFRGKPTRLWLKKSPAESRNLKAAADHLSKEKFLELPLFS